MRDALSLLDQAIAYSLGKVEESIVRNMLGTIDQGFLFDLLQALKAGDGAGLLKIADDMALRSMAFDAALQELATLLHRIALAQTVPLAISDDEPERIRLLELAQQFSPEEIQLNYQIVIHGRNEIDLAPDEYAGFTMTLLRMLAFIPQTSGVSAESLAVATSPKPATPTKPQRAANIEQAKAEPIQIAPIQTGNIELDWNTLLAQLNLQGMALQLAKNSVLSSFVDGRLILRLAPQHKHLQSNKIAQEKLQAALSEYFAKPIRLVVELAASIGVVTPAAAEQQVKQERQQHADTTIASDAFVREAQRELGAHLVENSIKPI
jgi:DNA polymerase-3 subunit gamma/tau